MTDCEVILYHQNTFPTYNAAYFIQIDSNNNGDGGDEGY